MSSLKFIYLLLAYFFFKACHFIIDVCLVHLGATLALLHSEGLAELHLAGVICCLHCCGRELFWL